MKCPICDVELIIAKKQGVDLDQCTRCRGVWLDHGELEKIIERSASQRDFGGGERREHYEPRYKRKHRFWKLFDFD
jgi:uncharacterized protein